MQRKEYLAYLFSLIVFFRHHLIFSFTSLTCIKVQVFEYANEINVGYMTILDENLSPFDASTSSWCSTLVELVDGRLEW